MPTVKPDLQKLENLLSSATNARQRKMYESLLAKARKKYQKVEPAPQPEIESEAKVTSPTKTKQKTQKVKEEKIKAVELKATEKDKSKKSSASTEPIDNKNTKTKQKAQKEEATIFQATGLITCTPKISEDGNLYITVDDQDYDLKRGYFNARRNFDKLKQEIIENGSRECRLIVYPKIAHNLAEDKIYSWFALVKESPTNSPKQEGFILRGVWQQVNHCVKPVISIYRNIAMLHLYNKVSTPAAKKAFARPQDFPVVWSAPIEPFRYNSKLKKDEQMPRYFVQVRAIFKDGQFQVTEMIEEPTLDIPKYIKIERKNTKHPKKSPKSNKE